MLYDKVDYTLATTACGICVIAALFSSFLWALFLCILYVVGLVWGTQLISYVRSNYISQNHDPKIFVNESCGICGDKKCKRHERSSHVNQIPKVPKSFDDSLEELLEQLLQTYVCVWYADLSSNEAFIQQLRLAITSAATNITNRLFKADISSIIFNHLIPIGIRHAQDWQELTKRAKELGGTPTDHIADYLGSKIHPAAYSREAELEYLRTVITTLLPHLLPATHISSNNRVILREVLANWVLLPAMDALCDPENLNLLISLCTHHEGDLSREPDAMHIPLLHGWISNPFISSNPVSLTIKPNLEEVLNNPELLYMFMQHIKASGIVNLLQFCLDIDDLSKRMLNPEITPALEETLFTDAQNIYTTYLDPDSFDYLNLPSYISEGMKEILDGGPRKIQELRTSRPLYQAHQEAHALLENMWLPSFHHSYQLYKFLCGNQVSNSTVKMNNLTSGSIGVGARLTIQLGKIRGVLKASAVDGAPFQSQVFPTDDINCTPKISTEGSDSVINRDLTTWRVTVPHVDGAGAFPLYMVSIHSASENKSWTVLRRDQDFYALRARLSEFHGDRELNDSPLPSRKNPHPSLSANRQCYQDFLQKLLAKPTLKSSELLHTFLTVPNLKPYFTNYSTPDIGVLYQSMAHKLRKEKGQHLDKFMSTFLSSTHVRGEHTDVGVELVGDQSLHDQIKKGSDISKNWLFKNNLSLDQQIQNFPYIVNKFEHAKGVSFCIAEAVTTLIEIPPTVSQILWATASVLHNHIDPFVNRWFYDLIVKLLSGGRAALVVKLLQESIFEDVEDMNSNKSEEFYKEAKEGLHNLLPWWLSNLHSKWCELMDSLLEPLQNAPFNKHLAYVLVDQLLINLFPELL